MPRITMRGNVATTSLRPILIRFVRVLRHYVTAIITVLTKEMYRI